MESLTKKLTDIVSREVLQFELVLQLMADQQNYLVANDLENLNRVVKEQEEAILKVRELEKSRLLIIDEISDVTDDDSENLTLTQIAKKLALPQAEKLQRLQKTLLDLHEKITRARSRNEFLIKKSMEHIEGTVRLLASSGVDVPTYRESTNVAKPAQSIMVNRTV
ncbi:MAG: flagellar protein FlgN [candidate division Zixibacteria bacterium]|nr:flagellar protein FlgN [candidate division Zixibacteria bacterium]